METIGVVGANCRGVKSETLARLTIPKDERVDRLPELARRIGVSELVYIATCNRVEVVFRGDGETAMRDHRRRVFAALAGREPRSGEAERTLHAWAGEGAAEHLFLVTSGLDSAQAGEREVRAQVREALLMAREAGVSGSLIDFVVTRALRVALRVHQKVPMPGQRVSLADIAVECITDRLHRTPGRVALIGVSPICSSPRYTVAPSGLELISTSAQSGTS